jgi:nucleoside-diphosphate-sugar epimerase
LGRLGSRRSLIGLDNLVDLICHCVSYPSADGQNFLVSDGEVLSTQELIGNIAKAQGHSASLIPVQVAWLNLFEKWAGLSGAVERLIGSLHVDIFYTCKTLHWNPPYRMEEGVSLHA